MEDSLAKYSTRPALDPSPLSTLVGMWASVRQHVHADSSDRLPAVGSGGRVGHKELLVVLVEVIVRLA